MTAQPEDSWPTLSDRRLDFRDGASWRCTSCGAEQTIGTDDDSDETGLPAHYNPTVGIAICDACTDDRPLGEEHDEYWG